MLRILAQTVCSLILLISVVGAKEIPIVKEINLYIPYKEFSVIEMPFKITGSAFTPFSYTQTKKKNEGKSVDPTYTKPSLNKKQPVNKKLANKVKNKLAIQKAKKQGPIDVVKGTNFFRLYPKKVGSTELLIWGYSKFPIMLKLHVTKDKEISEKQIKFIDTSSLIKQAEKFESTYHDRVVMNLTKALYADTIPAGYKEDSLKKEFYSGGLHIILVKKFLGKRYMGEVYLVTNQSDDTIILDAQMFETTGIYGITFINNVLKPDTTTRLFIVREKV